MLSPRIGRWASSEEDEEMMQHWWASEGDQRRDTSTHLRQVRAVVRGGTSQQGGLAQMVERSLSMREAAGSIPASSNPRSRSSIRYCSLLLLLLLLQPTLTHLANIWWLPNIHHHPPTQGAEAVLDTVLCSSCCCCCSNQPHTSREYLVELLDGRASSTVACN